MYSVYVSKAVLVPVRVITLVTVDLKIQKYVSPQLLLHD